MHSTLEFDCASLSLMRFCSLTATRSKTCSGSVIGSVMRWQTSTPTRTSSWSEIGMQTHSSSSLGLVLRTATVYLKESEIATTIVILMHSAKGSGMHSAFESD